jgi:triacylglycerol esterase/lipase EstA (alpha/beta hydrolase family)
MTNRNTRRPRRTLGGAVASAVVALAVVLTVSVSSPAGAAAPTYRVGDTASGYAAWLANPLANPPGVNVWSCRPSAAHPRPVILLPGTTARVNQSFSALGPILADQGYCVYGLNYGDSLLSTLSLNRIGATGDIPTAARQLAGFVTTVLGSTGASKVDIVGWSQGGMKYLGGAAKVDRLVGLSPSNHGTTLFGLLSFVGAAETAAGFPLLSAIGCAACDQQTAGSPFLTALNAGGDTVPGVTYTVIETKYDDVVTPYVSEFLTGGTPGQVTNILLQNQCSTDFTDHLGIPYDTNALQDVVNALGPATANFQPVCGLALPLIGSG